MANRNITLSLPEEDLKRARIVCSAASLGCQTLHSEDLNPGQLYDGVRVRNPFLAG